MASDRVKLNSKFLSEFTVLLESVVSMLKALSVFASRLVTKVEQVSSAFAPT